MANSLYTLDKDIKILCKAAWFDRLMHDMMMSEIQLRYN